MPSKQTNNDVIAIEELVNEIKQNLRLKAAPPTIGAGAAQTLQHPLLQPPNNEQFLQQPKSINHPPQQQLVIKKQRSRPSPYHIPCRSWSENSTVVQKPRKSCKNDENNIEDPYELLQSLLKNNSLVKEAVRRLQLNNASAYSRKQNYFYDSDEDRSPIVMMCQLES